MPLPSELDLWPSAGIMVSQYGSRAPMAAKDRAKRLEAASDNEGAATWRLIVQWCKELLNQEGTRQWAC